MDPISVGIAAIGAGLSFFGANREKKNRQRIGALEQQKNEINLERMRLDALTQTRDTIRAAQLRTATGINAAANSGAGLDSSAVAGGQAQVVGSQNLRTNLIAQGLQFGERTSNLNEQIGALGSRSSDNQLISSIGSSLFSNSRTIGGFFGEGGQSQRNPWTASVSFE